MIIYGQIFALMQQLILPWSFILFKDGVENAPTKFNQAIYYSLFFLCLMLPFLYYLQLIQSRRQ